MIRLSTKDTLIAPHLGKQALFATCPCNEIFCGGARGGGKSWGALLFFARKWANLWKREETRGKLRAILFRPSYPELTAIISESHDIYRPLGARWYESKKTWLMPDGAMLIMRPLENMEDARKHQGHQFALVIVDEVGNYASPEPIDTLRACVRNPHGILSQLVLVGNWGGPGHNWLKRRYYDPVEPMTPIAEKSKLTGETWTKVFIPSGLEDNPSIEINDPGYRDRIVQACEGKPWLLEAWLHGNPKIVAGGLLDAVWTSSVHVIDPFRVPANWKLDRSYDYGYSAPFSVPWWAESNGEEVCLANGDRRSFPSGTLFCIAEWCGVATKPSETGGGREIIPNKGIEMVATDVAKGIVAREKAMRIHGRCKPGPADSSIFDTDEGSAIADDMAKHGVEWTRAAKGKGSRVAGAEALIQRLSASLKRPMEDPGIFFFSTCRNIIRTVPAIPRDPKNRDDADTKAEDHDYDAVRYRIRAPVVHDVEEVGVIGI